MTFSSYSLFYSLPVAWETISEICIKDIYWEIFLGSRMGGIKSGWGVDWNVVPIKDSIDLIGSWNVSWKLSLLRHSWWNFIGLYQSVFGYWLPGRGSGIVQGNIFSAYWISEEGQRCQIKYNVSEVLREIIFTYLILHFFINIQNTL